MVISWSHSLNIMWHLKISPSQRLTTCSCLDTILLNRQCGVTAMYDLLPSLHLIKQNEATYRKSHLKIAQCKTISCPQSLLSAGFLKTNLFVSVSREITSWWLFSGKKTHYIRTCSKSLKNSVNSSCLYEKLVLFFFKRRFCQYKNNIVSEC